MTDSPEKSSLRNLTLIVVKSITALKKLLQSEASPQRDKKILRALTELEVNNDEAMRVGLELSASRIAQMKTGRTGNRSPSSNSSAPRVQSPFSQLMEHHAKQFVDRRIPDAAAQGSAIKYILESFTPDLAIKKYNQQLEESQGKWRVSWLTVRKDIGRMQTNGVRPLNAGERNDAQYSENLDFIANLRGDDGRDYH